MKSEKALIIFGTRPEFIKLLPVFNAIEVNCLKEYFVYVFTGQHPDLVIDLFKKFNFNPHFSLKTSMHENLADSVSDMLSNIQNCISELSDLSSIRLIIGQGDTTSCYSASMAAFVNKIPFAHIEAGLRTYDLDCPFPEEYFRQSISTTADIHFAPTRTAFNNLVKEGISEERVYLTGNTLIDFINEYSVKSPGSSDGVPFKRKNIIITCHRRENQNEQIFILIEAINKLAGKRPEFDYVWISHPSPFITEVLSGKCFSDKKNIRIIAPLDVLELYNMYENTALIITDSGGIQEEAPSFNIPVIVIREKTERMESIQMDYSIRCEMNISKIDKAFNRLISTKFIKMINPYGDGHSSDRILEQIMRYYFSVEMAKRQDIIIQS